MTKAQPNPRLDDLVHGVVRITEAYSNFHLAVHELRGASANALAIDAIGRANAVVAEFESDVSDLVADYFPLQRPFVEEFVRNNVALATADLRRAAADELRSQIEAGHPPQELQTLLNPFPAAEDEKRDWCRDAVVVLAACESLETPTMRTLETSASRLNPVLRNMLVHSMQHHSDDFAPESAGLAIGREPIGR